MSGAFAQHPGLAAALLCVLVVILVLLPLIVVRRGRGGRAAAPVSSPAVLAPALPTSAELLLAVEDAEKSGRDDTLPALYLSVAQRQIAEGGGAQAEELLRKCIRSAAGLKLKGVHAAARVELGDLAHENGDATTACEHWQIARALFHELGQKREHDEVEARMLRNGCPTDWVLTDF